jgi:hypothetical protein
MPDEHLGPYVSVACICQTPIQEVSGQLSIVRVTDRVQVVGITPQMQPQPLQNLFLVVILRSGELRNQSHVIKVQPISPRAEPFQSNEASVLFEGDERGPGFITPVTLVATEPGLYWFEVTLDGQFLTRIPLRVQYQRAQALPFQPPPQQQP